MSREDLPKSRILTARLLADVMRESNRNGARFCFILGAGASVESGIPSGGALEMRWMNCIMGTADDDGTSPKDPNEMRALAEQMKADKYMVHSFDELVDAWNTAKDKGWRALPSELYFDLYNLRFFPDYDNGYHYLERLMEDCTPSMGYRVLALLLTEEGNRNNLVITTNFDSLVEDALFLYGEKKPLSVSHEALAGFFSSNIQRPIIAKVHRGLFLRPFNTPQQTSRLNPGWKKVLDSALENYIPVVIGYGGGDGSLMSYLERISPRKKFYWCYRPGPGYDWVEERVENLLRKKKNGYLVQIDGFDSLMLELGSQRFADSVTPTETVKLLQDRCKKWADNYQEQYNDLRNNPAAKEAATPVEQAEERREAERAQENELSAWDYLRRGNRACDEGDYQQAIDYYSDAIGVEPDDVHPYAYYNRGTAWGNQGEYQKAIADFGEAIRLKPDFAEAYNNLGVSWGKQGEPKKAIAGFSEAIRLKSDFVEGYNSRGLAWGMQGEPQKAITDFSEAIRMKPDYADAYNNRGVAWDDLGEYQKALDDCNVALRLNPSYAEAYDSRGTVWHHMGNHQKAIADFSEAIRLNPKLKLAYQNRAKAYRAIGKDDLADQDEAIAASLTG